MLECQVIMSITLLSDETKKTKIDKVTSWLLAAIPTRQKRGFKRLVELIAKGLDTSEFLVLIQQEAALLLSDCLSLFMGSCELNGLCDMPSSPGLDSAFSSLDQPYAGTGVSSFFFFFSLSFSFVLSSPLLSSSVSTDLCSPFISLFCFHSSCFSSTSHLRKILLFS